MSTNTFFWPKGLKLSWAQATMFHSAKRNPYPRFLCMKQLEIFLLPLERVASALQG